MAMDPPDTLLLVRRLDGLTYRFVRETDDRGGAPSYRRADLPLWMRGSRDHGWVVEDAAGVANGWPTAGALDPDWPPLVSWRSQKGPTSYLYDLRAAGDRPVPGADAGEVR